MTWCEVEVKIKVKVKVKAENRFELRL